MKFNFRLSPQKTQTRNHEGAAAWTMTPELELYSAVATTLLSDAFYEAGDQRLTRICNLVAQNKPEFVAQLAVYAREKLHLRSVPQVLAVELAKTHKGTDLVRRTVRRTVARADEITELLAYYQTANNRAGPKRLNKLSKQVQHGLADAFNRFDAYQFAKYDRAGTGVSLRDALFLVHPKAKDAAQQAVFDQIATRTLPTPDTWEVRLSAAGQVKDNAVTKTEAKQEAWAEMVQGGKMGYMALLRNLRNLLEANLNADVMQTVLTRLGNAQEVRRSKQLPFRFFSAYLELMAVKSPYTALVLEALEKAVAESVVNLPDSWLNGSVLIAVDASGSMQTAISKDSAVHNFDIGCVLAAALMARSRRVQMGLFGDTWKRVTLPRGPILGNALAMRKQNGSVGHATNAYLVLEELVKTREVVDRLVMFTDMQFWSTDPKVDFYHIRRLWAEYKKIAPGATLVLVDLVGYGQAPLSLAQPDVYLVAGFSDKVFQVLAEMERGAHVLDAVKAIEL